MKKILTFPKLILFFECILFIIIIAGCFNLNVVTPYAIGTVENRDWPTRPKLSGWNDERLKRNSNESDLDYAIRMNSVVGSSYYHCKYYTKENIFELIASFFSKTWKEVGFLQPERRCGFCHQASYILAKVLNTNGVEAYPLGMNGHVVVKLKDHDVEYILDPDYAVGPLEYKEDMRAYIPTNYGTSWVFRSLYKPYTTKVDDSPYYTMEWLNNAEKEQSRILRYIKFVYYGCIFLFICNSILLIMSIRKKWLGAKKQL